MNLALLTLFVLPLPAADKEPEILWKGSAHTADELPEPARVKAEAWQGWAVEHDYEMGLTKDGRVLLLVPAKRSLSKLIALEEDVLEYVDSILPPVEPRPLSGERMDQGVHWIGIDELWKSDAETAVLIHCRNVGDYRSALDLVVEGQDYLDDWARAAAGMSGFTLQRPLCAAWLESGPGLEEWDPANELVNRLAQLMTARRFDQQPFWLLQGIGWHVENHIRRNIYCFPYRNEFVYAAEHTAWKNELKRSVRKEKQIDLGPMLEWRRGTFKPEPARMSWGMVTYLVKKHDGALSQILDDFRRLRMEKGVRDLGSGNWEWVVGWEPSPEDQVEVLTARTDPEFKKEVLDFFKKGR